MLAGLAYNLNDSLFGRNLKVKLPSNQMKDRFCPQDWPIISSITTILNHPYIIIVGNCAQPNRCYALSLNTAGWNMGPDSLAKSSRNG